jgi:hypothetical protein
MKLKEILDKFGWEKVQQGQLPPEIKPKRDKFVRDVHQYDLYALNGVFVVTEDNKSIVALSGIAKTPYDYPYDYVRRAQIPQNTTVRVDNMQEFLEGFKHLHSFRNQFVFVKEERMDFHNIGERIEEAGELYRGR